MPRRRRSKPRGRVDWVYRGDLFAADDIGQQEPMISGTYGTAIALPLDTLIAQVLYDSTNFAQTALVGAVDAGSTVRYTEGAWGRAEGVLGGPLIHGVEVAFEYGGPNTWSAAVRHDLCYRIVVADQDPDLGIAQLDTFYDLWRNLAGVQPAQVARFANGRQNCAEHRMVRHFNAESTNPFWYYKKYHRFKRRLQPQEALFILFQSSLNSVEMRLLHLFCRTLVEDDS